MKRIVALLAAGLGIGCASGGVEAPAAPSERDVRLYFRETYAEFVSRHPGVHEPNYLPFMTWAVETPPPSGWRGWLARIRGEAPAPDPRRILCRWDESDFPLRTFVEAPEVPEDDEIGRRPPSAEYVAAAERALEIWERDLDGRVAFTAAPSAAEAALVIRLIGERAPVPGPGVKVLGTTPVRDACRVVGPGDETRVEVEFSIPELRVYIADEFGPLLPDQVEKLVLHEVGHALGMREHSPIPADLMYAVARDRIPARRASAPRT